MHARFYITLHKVVRYQWWIQRRWVQGLAPLFIGKFVIFMSKIDKKKGNNVLASPLFLFFFPKKLGWSPPFQSVWIWPWILCDTLWKNVGLSPESFQMITLKDIECFFKLCILIEYYNIQFHFKFQIDPNIYTKVTAIFTPKNFVMWQLSLIVI